MAAAPKTFEAFVEQEKARINAHKQEAIERLKAAQKEIDEYDRELGAVNAYIAVKSGKAAAPNISRVGTAGRAPRGSRQQELSALIGKYPDGVARGDIIKALGMKGNKTGEQSVSNALNNMLKAQKIGRKDGKYVLA